MYIAIMDTKQPDIRERFDPDEKERICLEILQQLPEWFGLPEAILAYGREVRNLEFLQAGPPERPDAAFAALSRHFPETGEIHVMGVRPGFQGQGLGRMLVEALSERLREGGARYLMVKTLGPSHPDPHYARTRHFYRRLGFVPLEEMKDIWEGNPCLLMVKPVERSVLR